MLVTSLDEQAYPTDAMPRFYRERADCENVFDELQNQWGWTQKPAPCHLMANLIALVHTRFWRLNVL